jgi:hypothetical protein
VIWFSTTLSLKVGRIGMSPPVFPHTMTIRTDKLGIRYFTPKFEFGQSADNFVVTQRVTLRARKMIKFHLAVMPEDRFAFAVRTVTTGMLTLPLL